MLIMKRRQRTNDEGSQTDGRGDAGWHLDFKFMVVVNAKRLAVVLVYLHLCRTDIDIGLLLT